ncbi:hypothetical protein K1719_037075 [Acacia pycnantha]|nr:hypothetical protein K1719_037075 [Acacia pycnantha]
MSDMQKGLANAPPLVTNLLGRPPKKRNRTEEAERRRKKSRSSHHRTESSSAHMPQQGGIERITKRGKTQKCSRCNKPGHNKSSCKEPPCGQQQPKAAKVRRMST